MTGEPLNCHGRAFLFEVGAWGRKDNRKLFSRHNASIMSSQRSKPSASPLHHDLLVRGVILTLIGLVLLIAPHFMAASDTRELFVHARIPAWFSLVLGVAFIGQYALRQRKRG